MYGRRLTTLPGSQQVEEDISCRKRYRHVNERLQHFWTRWHREYLTDLRESHNCNAKRAWKEPKVGDVVIVFEDGAKRNSWKMAVIEELIHRRDNKVRGANVRVVTKEKLFVWADLYKSFTLSKSGRVLQTCLGVERGRENAKERCKSVLLLAELWH